MENIKFNKIHSKGDVTINGDKISLRKFKSNDYSLFEELIKDNDYSFYFCLDGKDSDFFKNYVCGMIMQMEMGLGIAFTIETKGIFFKRKIGYIVGDYTTLRSTIGSERGLNINFAILPKYRNKGYATDAVRSLAKAYQSSPIKMFIMDIAESNKASIKIATKLDFLKDSRIPLFDVKHSDIGTHYKWFNAVSWIIKKNGK